MRLIDRYILREIVGVFFFGVALFTTLLLVNHLFFLARLGADTAISLRTNLALLVLRVPYLTTYSLPFSMLFGALLTFARLSERNEVTALRTSGWSLARVSAPVLFAGVMVMLGALALGEWVVPAAETRFRQLLTEAVRGGPAQQIQRNVHFRESIDGVDSLFYVREIDPREGKMERVAIIQFQQDRPARVIEAAQARYGPSGWVLYRGALYLLGGEGGVATTFEEMRVALGRTPAQIAEPPRDPYEMSIRELRQQIRALRAAGISVVKHAVSLQAKLALPTSSVFFALLAVPLGLRPHRSGRSIGFGVTIFVLLVYWLMMSVTLTLGERGKIGSIWAAWLPNILVAATGGVLLWRVR
ncbi:MAG: LptF/LptG family permease [Armatimonadota bacterium]